MGMSRMRRALAMGVIGGAATTTFSPDNITGLVGWWDARALSTLFQDAGATTPVAADNDPVGLWRDRSAVARHASQATAGAKPTYKASAINTRPALSFDGDDTLAFSSLALTNFTVFVVYDVSVLNTLSYLLTSATGGIHAGGTTAGVDGYGATDGTNLRTSNAEPTDAGIVAYQNAHLYRNGVEATYSSTGTPTGLTLTLIGGRASPTTLTFKGLIGEILIYNSQLIAAQLTQVNDYLTAKWITIPDG